jgi:hypothetical protein
MKLYGYCVTSGAIDLTDTRGLFDQRVYDLMVGNVSAIVSDIELDAAPVTKDNILIHQEVVRKLLETRTPLPFRFGAVAAKEKLISYLEARQQALSEKLELVDGCVEMGIKIIWPKSEASESNPTADDNANVAEIYTEGPGAAFLRSRQRRMVGNQQLADEANGIATWLKNRLVPFVRTAQYTVRPLLRLVLTGDCLVERSRVDSYQAAVELARAERPDLHFLTSGPWAPYSFSNIDLEFKSDFGVS